MAPLVKALAASDAFEPCVVVTAQHREMLDQVLTLFDIQPDVDLNLMKPGQTLTDITAGVLAGIEKAIAEEKPDMVLVHGDTTTTFAGALAAFYQQVPVGHIEAGLRSGNMASPFPEEANRRLTGVLAALHFSPTAGARVNLLREGVAEEQIFVTGNTVIDALQAVVRPDYIFSDETIQAALARPGQKILLTTHRRENLGEPMRDIFKAVHQLIQDLPQLTVIFPIHKNPKVRALAKDILGDDPAVVFSEPLDYEPFAHLMANVDLIMTDSGGLQEEAPALGKPVLVLRDTTERPEAVAQGTVRLVGTDAKTIYHAASLLLTDSVAYESMANAVNPYGDGAAAERSVAFLSWYFGLSKVLPPAWDDGKNN